jgi:hypothetical protein
MRYKNEMCEGRTPQPSTWMLLLDAAKKEKNPMTNFLLISALAAAP